MIIFIQTTIFIIDNKPGVESLGFLTLLWVFDLLSGVVLSISGVHILRLLQFLDNSKVWYFCSFSLSNYIYLFYFLFGGMVHTTAQM